MTIISTGIAPIIWLLRQGPDVLIRLIPSTSIVVSGPVRRVVDSIQLFVKVISRALDILLLWSREVGPLSAKDGASVWVSGHDEMRSSLRLS